MGMFNTCVANMSWRTSRATTGCSIVASGLEANSGAIVNFGSQNIVLGWCLKGLFEGISSSYRIG
jgi:hypothetical protein